MTARHAAAAAVFVAAVLAGCSAQPAPPPPAPPAVPAPTAAPAPTGFTPETCAAAVEFQNAANAIVELDATKVGTEGVKAALQDLATAGKELGDAASAQFGPQVAEVEQALTSLETTIAQIGDEASLSAKLGALAGSVAQVEAAAKPIIDSVRAGCPDVPQPATPEPA
jgi:hypothetical protein